MTAAAELAKTSKILLPLTDIRRDGGTQSRAELNEETIQDYASRYGDGLALPPVTVFYDGTYYWLADGFHRCEGAARSARDSLPAEVRQGSVRDAILFSVGANAAHGQRRTNADKRRAVEMLLSDEEWSKKSDRWIAERCAVGHVLVNGMRKQLFSENSSTGRLGQDGKMRRLPEAPKHREPDLDEDDGVNSRIAEGSASEAPAERRGRPRSVDHAARELDVVSLHAAGLGTAEVARRLDLAPSIVSKVKTRLGIAENSPAQKLWADVDHVATTLEGVALKVEQLANEVLAIELGTESQEIDRCISSLSKSSRTVRALINALKRKRR